MTPVARWALRAYPPSFRDRYGDELAAMAEDLAPSWRHTGNLYLGAARAWLRPAFTGPDSSRCRLQASVTTVWVAWCAGFLLAPTINKALLDPPGPEVDATVRRLVDLSAVILAVGWVVALAAMVAIGSQALGPALRARHWAVLRPLAPALVLGAIEAAGLLTLAWAASSDVSRPSPATIALATVWVVGLLAFLVSTGFGPAVAIRRLHPDGVVLRVPTLLAAVLSLCLAAMTATCAAAVLIAGDASLIGTFAPVAAAVAVGVVASSTALVSSARGVLALRGQA
jgi:hypothetical protein